MTKIVRYTDNWGGTGNYGLIRAGEPQDRYEDAANCHDAQVVWVRGVAPSLSGIISAWHRGHTVVQAWPMKRHAALEHRVPFFVPSAYDIGVTSPIDA